MQCPTFAFTIFLRYQKNSSVAGTSAIATELFFFRFYFGAEKGIFLGKTCFLSSLSCFA